MARRFLLFLALAGVVSGSDGRSEWFKGAFAALSHHEPEEVGDAVIPGGDFDEGDDRLLSESGSEAGSGSDPEPEVKHVVTVAMELEGDCTDYDEADVDGMEVKTAEELEINRDRVEGEVVCGSSDTRARRRLDETDAELILRITSDNSTEADAVLNATKLVFADAASASEVLNVTVTDVDPDDFTIEEEEVPFSPPAPPPPPCFQVPPGQYCYQMPIANCTTYFFLRANGQYRECVVLEDGTCKPKGATYDDWPACAAPQDASPPASPPADPVCYTAVEDMGLDFCFELPENSICDEFYQTNANDQMMMCTANEAEGKEGKCTKGAKIEDAPEPSCA
jgi:hypothetical protein